MFCLPKTAWPSDLVTDRGECSSERSLTSQTPWRYAWAPRDEGNLGAWAKPA